MNYVTKPYELYIVKLLGKIDFCKGYSLMKIDWNEKSIRF